MTAAVADRPDIRMYTAKQYADEQANGFSAFVWVSTAPLGLSVLIAVLGIVNTLALSVMERTREVGLLRAVGMSGNGVRTMIRVEAMLIAVVGGVIGTGAGIVLGTMLQHAVLAQGASHTTIPLQSILGLIAAMAVAGVMAGEWPGRQASRVNVLEAIGAD